TLLYPYTTLFRSHLLRLRSGREQLIQHLGEGMERQVVVTALELGPTLHVERILFEGVVAANHYAAVMAFRSSIVAVCKCLFGPTELCLCHERRVGMVLRQLVQYRRRFSIAAVQRIGLGQLVAQLVDVYTLGGLRPAR